MPPATVLRRAALAIGTLCSLCSGFARAQAVPSALWPMYQYRADHNAVFDLPAWDVAWHADIADKNNGGLTIVGDTVYVESFNHAIFAFNALTGERRWQQPLDDVAMATSLVDRSLVYAGTGTGRALIDDGRRLILGRAEGNAIYAIDRSTGRIAWRYNTIGQDMPSGVLFAQGTRTELVFHNGDGHVRALDSQTGALLWERETPGSTSMSSLALADGIVYGVSATMRKALFKALAATDRSRLDYGRRTWALRASDGKFLWTSPYGAADCSPTFGDGIVFVEAAKFASIVWANDKPDYRKSKMYSIVAALDARTGNLLWQYASASGTPSFWGSSISASPGMYARGVFYETLPLARRFSAFDAKTGRIRWVIPTHSPVKMSAVLKDGIVYFGDTGGYFYVVRASDGAIERTIKWPGNEIFGCGPPVIVGNMLYVTAGQQLYAVRLEDLKSGIVP